MAGSEGKRGTRSFPGRTISGSTICRGVTIGAGRFSHVQMEAWKRLAAETPLAAIVAVCDLDGARARAFASKWGIPQAYTDAERALDSERPDFVDIVTPPQTHLELARCAAGRGAAVLCQKPLAPTYEDGVQLVDICEARGVRLMVNENWRWQRWYREIAHLIAGGAIGEPFYARFTVRRGDGRGEEPFPAQPYFRKMKRLLLHETLVHFIDTSRFLWGEIATVHVTQRRVNPGLAGEDMALVTLGMKSGVTVLIDANRWSDPPSGSDKTFGTVRIEGRGGQIELTPDARILVTPAGETSREHPYGYHEGGYFGDGCYYAQRHFVECLRSGAEFETNGRDYLETFRAVRAGYESAESDVLSTAETAGAAENGDGEDEAPCPRGSLRSRRSLR